LEYKFQSYDVTSVKENRLYYSNAKMSTDDWLIFSGTSLTKEFHIFDQFASDMYYLNNINDTQVKFYIHYTRTEWSFERSYIKIPDIFAVVGGLMNILQEVVYFLYDKYTDIHFKLFMFDNLFNIAEDPDDEKTDQKHQQPNFINIPATFANNNSSTKDINTSNGTFVKDPNLSPQELSQLSQINQKPPDNKLPIKLKYYLPKKIQPPLNNDINHYIKYQKAKREQVEIKPLTLCLYTYFCYKKTKNKSKTIKLIDAVEHQLKKSLDIILVIKNIDQLNNANKTLLNKNQYYMLKNKMPKIVSIPNKEDGASFKENRIRKERDNLEDLVKYLKRKIDDKTLSDIDRLLYFELDPELKMLINCEVSMDIN